jgi:hypothetical protein
VKLGLLLAELGQKNEMQVSDAEMTQAIMNQARQYPGQERAVLRVRAAEPGAQQQIRAPLFEDKVVDFVFEMAEVTDQGGVEGRPEVSEPRVEVEDVSVARATPLRQPVPRPARPEPRDTVVILAPGADAPEVVVLRGPERSAPAVARSDIGNRWIVRRQGSGDVVAEVSLAEALAILTSR